MCSTSIYEAHWWSHKNNFPYFYLKPVLIWELLNFQPNPFSVVQELKKIMIVFQIKYDYIMCTCLYYIFIHLNRKKCRLTSELLTVNFFLNIKSSWLTADFHCTGRVHNHCEFNKIRLFRGSALAYMEMEKILSFNEIKYYILNRWWSLASRGLLGQSTVHKPYSAKIPPEQS